MTARRMFLAAIAAVASIAGAAAVAAADLATTVASPPAKIEVVIVGPEASQEALVEALAPVLSSDDRIVWRRENGAAAPPGTNGRPSPAASGIWVEAGPNGSIRIVAIADGGPRAARVVDAAAPPPVIAEVVAQIVHETAVALLARDADGAAARAGATGATPPRPAPQIADALTAGASPPRRRFDPRPFGYAVALGYVSRIIFADNSFRGTFGEQAGRAETGVGTSFTVLTRAAPFGLAAAVLLDRTTIATPAGGSNVGNPALDITRWSAGVMVGPVCRVQPSLELALSIGAGLDRVTAAAGVTGGGSAWVPAARSAFRVSLLFPPSGFEVAGALTLDLKPPTMFTQTGATSEYDIYGTNLGQPGFSIALGWRR